MKALKQSLNKISNKGVFVASISFLELNEKAIFTYKLEAGRTPSPDNIMEASNLFYQRRLDSKHIKEIKNYITDTILNTDEEIAVFPTSMLLAFNFDQDINVTDDIWDFELSQNFYIVDGQHRLFAMRQLYEEVTGKIDVDSLKIKHYLERYKFVCSLLVNYDLWEQSLIFADINFKQKKVSKSLYYEIFGSQYCENKSNYKGNYIYIAHSLVQFLNQSEMSPLKNCIKMLGTGKGIISQAFLVESILPMINSTNGIWYFNPTKGSLEDLSFRHMSNELISYLTAIKDTFPDLWPQEDLKHRSILLKTTGLGALIRLLSDIHICLPSNILQELKDKSENRAKDSYINYVTKNYLTKIKDQQQILFGLDGEFSQRSGKASENALYKALRQVIGFPTD